MYGLTFNRTGQTLWMRECRTDAERLRLEEFFFGAIARVTGLDRHRAELRLLDTGILESADYNFVLSPIRDRFRVRDNRAFQVMRPLDPAGAVAAALKRHGNTCNFVLVGATCNCPAGRTDHEYKLVGWLSQCGLLVLTSDGIRVDVLREGDMIVTGGLDFLEV